MGEAQGQEEVLKFHIELNVLKHLGLGLYSSTPAVVTEIIANAWDADAHEVDIKLEIDDDRIVVEDDGHGMTREDVQNKFLKVGYSRRTHEPTKEMSRSGERRVMGRKGIGKLAMFSLAKYIMIVTRAKGGNAVAFSVDVDELHKSAEKENTVSDYPVKTEDVPADFVKEQGTRIVLSGLNTKINKTEAFLRPRLARRFGLYSKGFRIVLNEKEVRRLDANFYSDLQFIWYFDEATRDEVVPLATSLAKCPDEDGTQEPCFTVVANELTYWPSKEELVVDKSGEEKGSNDGPSQALAEDRPIEPITLKVGGFIASVDKPSKLGKGDESLNRIAVFANGRVFQEDILPELGDARHFNNYLVGEIHADFLDSDAVDRATASREAIRHDDRRFEALRNHLRNVFKGIRDQWDDWRALQGYENTPDKNPKVVEWIASLRDPRDRRQADRLMTSIGKLNMNNDETKDGEAKRLLYRSAVVGFEKLLARNQLDRLEGVTDVLSPEFQAIFASLDDIEESYYIDIVRGRLEIIRKFEEEIVDEKKLEKVAQEYLFDHLWLLDPTWDRVQGSEDMEIRLSKELKKACPDTTEGARLDIAYRTTAGRHVIIELKQPGKKVAAKVLEDQGRKYLDAMEQWYRDHPDTLSYNGRLPPIDVYLLVDIAPTLSDRDAVIWDMSHLKLLTYKGLINNARAAYQSYLDVHKTVAGRLTNILDGI